MNRRSLSLGSIAVAASALLGRRPGAAHPPAGRGGADKGSAYLRTEAGDLLSVGGPYNDGRQSGVYQIGVWADDYWLINRSKRNDLSGYAPKRSAQNLVAIVDEEISFQEKHGLGADPFGGGMGLRLTRAELIQLRDAIDAQLRVPVLNR